MFSLFYGLFEYVTRKEELRILILGPDKAGKTVLLERLKTLYGDLPGLEADKILPTVGLNVGRLDALKASFLFWDLGGQPGLRSIWDKYYGDSHAVIYVVDAADPNRLEEAKRTLERVLGSQELFGAPLLLAANKQDLGAALPAPDVQEALGLGKLDSRPTRVQPLSALTGAGVQEGLQWLLAQVQRSDRLVTLRHRGPPRRR